MTDVSRLPQPVAAIWEWQHRGACRGADADLFFHPEGARGSQRALREEAAKAVCRGCPVLEPCRVHALEVREPYGVWGGLTEAERPGTTAHERRAVPAPQAVPGRRRVAADGRGT